jgi:hypothetical protein
VIDDRKIYNFQIEKRIRFLKKEIICFVNVEIDPRLENSISMGWPLDEF